MFNLNEGNHTNEVSMMTEWELEHWNASCFEEALLEATKLTTNSLKNSENIENKNIVNFWKISPIKLILYLEYLLWL